MALKSIKEAAATWGVSTYTVRRLADAGIIHAVRVGRRRLIADSEIARIEATGVSVPTPPGASSTSIRASLSRSAARGSSPKRRRGE